MHCTACSITESVLGVPSTSSQESLNMEALWGSLFVSVLSHPDGGKFASQGYDRMHWHVQVMDQGEGRAPLTPVLFPPFARVPTVPLTQFSSARDCGPSTQFSGARDCVVFWYSDVF